jgi:hypothetical protein
MANEFRVKNGIICGGDILPDSDSTRDLGTSSLYYAEGYIDKLTTTGVIELGHATDTTIARASAGQITVEGTAVVLAGGANHDGFSDFVADEHIAHSGVTITAGTGMTGGGTIAATRTLNVIGGTGITANANDIAIDATVATLAGSQTFTGTKTLNSFKGTGGATVTNILDEDGMGSDSATALATQQSIVAYVQSEVGSAGGGDITAVVAGTGLSGGATSGAATVNMLTDLVYGPTGDQSQRNLGLGENAMNSITQYVNGVVTDGGNFNVGLGYNSGTALTTGDGNSLVGFGSGAATTTAGYNTSIGYNVLTTNITGHSNVAVGYEALSVPDAEDHNIAIGYDALGGSIAGGEKNIAIGSNALDSLTISGKTVAIGHNAGHAITGGSGTNGSENTLLGYQAGDALTTGENCVIIGSDADASAVGAANQIVIGKGAVGLADNSVVLGNTDVTAWLPPDDAGVDLGSSSYQFKDAYIHGTLEADAITIGGTNVVSGSLITTLGTISAGLWQGTAIAGGYIANDAIDSQHYADGSIDNAHIADNAIDSEHYADGSIDNAHIADDAIDSEHYADGSIDNAHIADDAIDSEHYAAGSIDTAHIADDQITLAKMAGITRGSIIIGDASANPAALAIGSNDYVLTSDGTDIAWEAAAGGGSVGGSDTEILYNNGGTEDGIPTFTYDDTSGSEQIELDASSDENLFRITQRGSGAAFRVEDTTTLDSSPGLEVSNAGNVGVGIASSAAYKMQIFGGVLRLYNQLEALAGTAGTPGLSFAGDVNTGIFQDPGDTLGFSTGGTSRMTIGSSGEVTIPGQMTSRANVVAITGNTTLTIAQSGSYVYWTAGTLTLPASGTAGTQYTVFNNTGGSATVALNASNCSIVSGWAGNAAVADHDATSYVCVSANNWVQVGA